MPSVVTTTSRADMPADSSRSPARIARPREGAEPAAAGRWPSMPVLADAFWQDLATVDDQGLAGDIAGLRRGQESHRPADVDRIADPAQRNGRQHLPGVLWPEAIESGGADVAGQYGIDGDASAGELEGGGPHQPEQGRLRCPVVRIAGLAGDRPGDR